MDLLLSALRWILLVLVAALALELFFVVRIATMAVIAFAWHKESPLLLQWLPVVAWLLAGGVLLAIARKRAAN